MINTLHCVTEAGRVPADSTRLGAGPVILHLAVIHCRTLVAPEILRSMVTTSISDPVSVIWVVKSVDAPKTLQKTQYTCP